MITHAASRKHYYTVLLDRPEMDAFFDARFLSEKKVFYSL